MQADEEYYITASYLLQLASRSYELFMGSEPEQKRQLIPLTLQNLEIEDGLLSYEWVKPFDSVFVSAKSHTWGQIRDVVINLQPEEISFLERISKLLNIRMAFA